MTLICDDLQTIFFLGAASLLAHPAQEALQLPRNLSDAVTRALRPARRRQPQLAPLLFKVLTQLDAGCCRIFNTGGAAVSLLDLACQLGVLEGIVKGDGDDGEG